MATHATILESTHPTLNTMKRLRAPSHVGLAPFSRILEDSKGPSHLGRDGTPVRPQFHSHPKNKRKGPGTDGRYLVIMGSSPNCFVSHIVVVKYTSDIYRS